MPSSNQPSTLIPSTFHLHSLSEISEADETSRETFSPAPAWLTRILESAHRDLEAREKGLPTTLPDLNHLGEEYGVLGSMRDSVELQRERDGRESSISARDSLEVYREKTVEFTMPARDSLEIYRERRDSGFTLPARDSLELYRERGSVESGTKKGKGFGSKVKKVCKKAVEILAP